MEPITSDVVAAKLAGYLRHEISLDDLVDWSERAMQEGEILEPDPGAVRDVVARLGLADLRAFGLTWEDCEEFLKQLGYDVRVEVVEQGS